MNLCQKYKFQIVDIQWERIFLNIKIKTDYNSVPRFVISKFKRTKKEDEACKDTITEVQINEMIDIVPEEFSNGMYRFTLNIAALNKRSFLDNGKWQIAVIIPEGFCNVSITNELAYQLDSFTRVFKYGRNKYAYNISFNTKSFDGENLEFVINSYFVIVNNKWKKRKYVQEAFSLRGKINRAFMFATIRLIRIYYRILSAFPHKGNKVLFMSETKDYIWGNLKYIHDRIIARGLSDQFDITVSCRKAVGDSNSILSWAKTVSLIARHDYIFIDDYAPIFGFFKLSDKTKLIQVWHAGEGFKSVGYSRFGKAGSPFPSESCHKAYDYVLTGSSNLVHVYEEVFGIEKAAFLPVGMPRLDDFLDADKIKVFREEFYAKYPALLNKKIILFAPTFRGTGQKKAYYDYEQLDLKKIYDFCGDEYVFIIKMHPFIKRKIHLESEYLNRIIDFTDYPNINDLYYVTDLLITDYSSNYYEYALMNKPVLFFTYDRTMYELTRGVHRSVKDYAPGKVCDSFEELMRTLETHDYEEEKIKKFVEENFGDYDGHACDRVIDTILLRKEESNG